MDHTTRRHMVSHPVVIVLCTKLDAECDRQVTFVGQVLTTFGDDQCAITKLCDQSTLTAACICCACRSILHDIQCSSKRRACCHRDVAWDRTVGAWTAWPSTFVDC